MNQKEVSLRPCRLKHASESLVGFWLEGAYTYGIGIMNAAQ